MSSPQVDGLKAEIDQGRMRVGNQVQLASGLPATGSQPLSTDSSGNLQATLPLAMAAQATTQAVFDVQGYATLSADEIMHGTLVAGAGVTTFTKTGFLQINVTDAAGNITSGKHYIQFGTLS